MYNLKAGSYVLLGDIAEDCSLGGSLSDSSGTVPKRSGWSQDTFIGVFAENKKHVVKHQKITANHKNQTSQVNDFSAEDVRVWAR